jgi:hypothetical protein
MEMGEKNPEESDDKNTPYSKNKKSVILRKQTSSNNGTANQGGNAAKCTLKFNSFVIQKYIENPLLIMKRKFDIRVWVLVNQNMDCYLCKEGYLRTASTEFKIDLQNVDDKFVHLTNNAV